jgi:hypothetical protein
MKKTKPLTTEHVEELVEIKGQFAGLQNKGYPGAFPPKVEEIIKRLVASPSLHLFSGTSRIGDVRIDLERPEATLNMDVFEFLKVNDQRWLWVIADPPYDVKDRYGLNRAYAKPYALNCKRQHLISVWLQGHADNVLWFDVTAPCPRGFYRKKEWLFHPGGWHHVRVLSWLKRDGERLA